MIACVFSPFTTSQRRLRMPNTRRSLFLVNEQKTLAKRSVVFLAAALILGFILPSMALASMDMSGAEVQSFCAQDRTQPPSEGVQFDNHPADQAIINLAPGTYSFQETGTVVLFPDNAFVVRLADSHQGATRGSNGDNYMKPGLLGGCFKEQLSEVLRNNNISSDELKAVH